MVEAIFCLVTVVIDQADTWESRRSGWSLLWGTKPLSVGYLFRSGSRNVASHLGEVGGSKVNQYPIDSSWANKNWGRKRVVRFPRGTETEQDKGQVDLGQH